MSIVLGAAALGASEMACKECTSRAITYDWVIDPSPVPSDPDGGATASKGFVSVSDVETSASDGPIHVIAMGDGGTDGASPDAGQVEVAAFANAYTVGDPARWFEQDCKKSCVDYFLRDPRSVSTSWQESDVLSCRAPVHGPSAPVLHCVFGGTTCHDLDSSESSLPVPNGALR